VVAVGIPHNELVEAVQRSFEGLTQRTGEAKVEASKYVGGEARVPNGGDTHVALAFEGVPSNNQKDSVALALLQRLLGGGSRFSRDGPGAGLQSRINTNVIATNENITTALAFNLPYSDTGLFGVYAQVSDNVPKALEALVSEVSKTVSDADATELTRAKELLKIDLLTGKRIDTLRFIGQQALSGSSAILSPEQHAALVDNVTAADVTRVARKVFASNPTLVVLGDVSSIPAIGTIKSTLTNKVK
jgi:processing peptidase subunit alpha